MAQEKEKVGWAPGAKSSAFGSITSDPWGSLMKWLETERDTTTEWKIPEVLRESPILRELFGWEQKDQQAGRFGMSPGEIKARHQYSLYNQDNVFSGPKPELSTDPDDDKISTSYYMAAGKDLLKQEIDGLMQEGYSREDAVAAIVTNKTLTDSLFKKARDQARIYDDGKISGINRIEDKGFYGGGIPTTMPPGSEQYDNSGNFTGYTPYPTVPGAIPLATLEAQGIDDYVPEKKTGLYGTLGGGFDAGAFSGGVNPFAGMKFGKKKQ